MKPCCRLNNAAVNERMQSFLLPLSFKTMEKTILRMDRGNSVNYTGGLLMHANGNVYAVSQSVLYKINPAKMEIVKSVDLLLFATGALEDWESKSIT